MVFFSWRNQASEVCVELFRITDWSDNARIFCAIFDPAKQLQWLNNLAFSIDDLKGKQAGLYLKRDVASQNDLFCFYIHVSAEVESKNF